MALSSLSLYSWKVRPNDPDGFIADYMPQPVAALVNGVAKILIFTNYQFYPSQGLNNNFNAVRVAEIVTPADTYSLTGHSLPGKRQDFAVASLANAAGTANTIYLFGGRNAGTDFGDIYAYTPGVGFNPVSLSLPTPRSAMTAVPALGKIYLFGGLQGSAIVPDVLAFDPTANTITKIATLAPGFHSARGMTKAVGTKHYIYLVGAKTTAQGGPTYGVWRFDPNPGSQANTIKQLVDKNNPSQKLNVPNAPASPTITWDPSGTIRILAASGFGSQGNKTWGGIDAWILTDQIGGSQDGHAQLAAAPYAAPARARDVFGAVKAGSATYIVGGTYGHGPTFHDRSKLVDRLDSIVEKVDVKIKTIPSRA
jgi:Galactose oxidase, central domain